MELNVFENQDITIIELAHFLIKTGNESIQDHGRFTLCLSGGSSPKKLYSLLANVGYREKIDWTKVFFFFGDERYVPQTHPDNNYLMVKSVLFDPLSIPETQIFPFHTELTAQEAGRSYYKRISDFFGGEPIQFDLVLLGLGDNSHTASLFPHTSILNDTLPGSSEVYLEDQKIFRLSINAPLINQANKIAFLVFGEGKAEAVHHILEGAKNISEYPAQLIKPVKGKLFWFMDKEAASKIHNL